MVPDNGSFPNHNAGAVVNDGALPDPASYLSVFPYLATPLPGSAGPALALAPAGATP